jgi:hypothetical protein
MNLLDRLSPEHLDRLKAEEERFPNTMKMLMKELANTNHWIDLTYQSIHTLYLHLELQDYSPTSVEKIFDHEKHL